VAGGSRVVVRVTAFDRKIGSTPLAGPNGAQPTPTPLLSSTGHKSRTYPHRAGRGVAAPAPELGPATGLGRAGRESLGSSCGPSSPGSRRSAGATARRGGWASHGGDHPALASRTTVAGRSSQDRRTAPLRRLERNGLERWCGGPGTGCAGSLFQQQVVWIAALKQPQAAAAAAAGALLWHVHNWLLWLTRSARCMPPTREQAAATLLYDEERQWESVDTCAPSGLPSRLFAGACALPRDFGASLRSLPFRGGPIRAMLAINRPPP